MFYISGFAKSKYKIFNQKRQCTFFETEEINRAKNKRLIFHFMRLLKV